MVKAFNVNTTRLVTICGDTERDSQAEIFCERNEKKMNSYDSILMHSEFVQFI